MFKLSIVSNNVLLRIETSVMPSSAETYHV